MEEAAYFFRARPEKLGDYKEYLTAGGEST